MKDYETLFTEKLADPVEPESYEGFENLANIPDDQPVIFIFSHKGHGDSAIGAETRHLTNMAVHFPGGERRIRHIVRPSDSRIGQLKQRVSPIHVDIATTREIKDDGERKAHNKKAIQRIVDASSVSDTPFTVSIAPDAGQTDASYPQLVNPDKVSAGGVVLLQRGFAEKGQTAAIIPVAFDHDTGRIVVGNDISGQFADAENDQKPQVLAEAINSLVA